MTTPSLLERAKAGEADAIAALLNQALHSQGIAVKAERQSFLLNLWLTGQTPPPQEWSVSYIRRGLERLQILSIGIVKIHGIQADNPEPSWTEEISLLAAFAQSEAALPALENFPATWPSALSPEPPGAATAQSRSEAELAQAYQALQVEPGASLSMVEAAYFQLKAELLKQGDRDAINALKAAFTQLKDELLKAHQPPQSPSMQAEATPPRALVELPILLAAKGLKAEINIQAPQLQIRLDKVAAPQSNRAVATVFTLLEQQNLEDLGLAHLSEVVVFSLSAPKKLAWKRTLPMPQQEESPDDTDLLSFKNRYVSAYGFPALMVLGMLMNTFPIVSLLLWGIKVWFHEFGHATIAWLGGRRAIPLPIGWTNIGAEQSLFVYLGVLILFSLMYWVGRREHLRWPMLLAVVLAVVQFWITWILPEHRFETLISFGGVGGEFYLCTLLMVSFHFPLPAYWRWDFYRYPVVLGAAFTFWGQFWLWRQIRQGQESIPWGSLWGGESFGDMNNLRAAGWSDQQIIGTYSTLGNLCLIALLSVYIYFAVKQNRHALFALVQRCQA